MTGLIESRILYEDNHLFVYDKPPRLATMGAEPGESSLVEQVKCYLKQKYNKPGNVFLGVVSRLDSFTSGVIVLARTSKAAARLSQQFSSRGVTKEYLAILEGIPSGASNHWCELQDWLVKDDRKRRMVVVDEGRVGAKEAKLQFRMLSRVAADCQQLDTLCLVQIRLETGRKHQIRVQFSSRGTPVYGDRKYGAAMDGLEGIRLLSHQLSFQHPVTKKRMGFYAGIPKNWQIRRFPGDFSDLFLTNNRNGVS